MNQIVSTEIKTGKFYEMWLASGELPNEIARLPEFPEPGFYLLTERRKAAGKSPGSIVWVKRDVPVRVWQVADIEEETGDYMSDVQCYGMIGEKLVDIYDKWLTWASWGFAFLKPIPEHHYRYLMADMAWQREYGEGEASPTPAAPSAPPVKTDFRTAPPPF